MTYSFCAQNYVLLNLPLIVVVNYDIIMDNGQSLCG